MMYGAGMPEIDPDGPGRAHKVRMLTNFLEALADALSTDIQF